MTRRIVKIFVFLLLVFLLYKAFLFFFAEKRTLDFENNSKNIFLNDNGLIFSASTEAKTVEELLNEKKLTLSDRDRIIPEKNQLLYPNTHIEIKRAVKIKIEVDGKKIDGYTLGKTVREAVLENNITLGRLDKSAPDLSFPPYNGIGIVVTRINVEEVTVKEDIDFKTNTKSDSKMGWREKKVETPGEKGIREVKYKITYRNGKEISRIILGKNIVKEPVTQIETQGTYVKVGASHKGQGTWYAFKGGLFAASPWLPMGSYARVTNTANGKSVIVQINDRGPFGPGRIIDLDKVAFQKIASIGAGVIGVKVEEILN